MELSMSLKQNQKLSPQMIQSMNILQMSALELQEYVENLLMENPALEVESEANQEKRSNLLSKVNWLITNDRQNRWYYREDAKDLVGLMTAPEDESLYEHLKAQLDMKLLSKNISIAVDCVLTGLNDRGYLEETVEELAFRCGQSEGTIKYAEELVRGLEPAGIACRTLAECLAIQLNRIGEAGLALTIVRDHLEDIAKGRYSRIARETGCSRQEIQEAYKLIRTLNPCPGAPFAPCEMPGYIIPDLFVVEVDGELVISANDGYSSSLMVSSYYGKLLKETDEKEVREYLSDKVRQANWVIKSIEQRQNTLLTCARIIVEKQRRFFRDCAGCLEPLSLADVAIEAGIHESTVSRAVKYKYIQCNRGVFALGDFFSRGGFSNNGEEVSTERVKQAVCELIAREDKTQPLSDQKISELLAERKIILSRRTVAKYRDELGIASTAGRREF